MLFKWDFYINIGLISFVLLAATYLRSKIKFFQRFLIPNALTAGFLLFFIINILRNFIDIDIQGLKNIVYHLLNISFISITLRKNTFKTKINPILATTFMIIIQYTIQIIAGLGLTFLLIKSFFPQLFPTFGFFIPLGFALGPGQALSFGEKWSELGFKGAPSIGVTFAALGYVWACFAGIFFINRARKKGWIQNSDFSKDEGQRLKTGFNIFDRGKKAGSYMISDSDVIDTLSLNLAIIFVIYFLVFLFLKFAGKGLALLGPQGIEFSKSLWSMAFIFGSIMAVLVKKIFSWMHIDFIIDNLTLNRISGAAIDYMVAAALGIISIHIVIQYWMPITITGIISGVIVCISVFWFSSRIFKDYKFHRALIIFGSLSGTLPTGLALLRVLDPEFKTPAASDYMYAAGITFPLVIPLIIMLDFPGMWITTGKIIWLNLTFIIIAFYAFLSIICFFYFAGWKLSGFFKIWHQE